MKRNGMCPVCYIRQMFKKPTSIGKNPESIPDFDNGMAKTPPMGWSSWNTFRNRIGEDMLLETATAMVEKGLVEAGYNHLNIDDNWHSSLRDDNGDLVGDYLTFPHGMEWLVKEVNKMGIKVGAYTSNGTLTCEDLPASLHRERQDSLTIAKWGIEYFKYDFCHHINLSTYAPLIYSITISDYEGNKKEYTVQNGILGGLAKFMPDDRVPNGKHVSGLDKNLGTLTFENVEVDNDGEYVLSINIRKKGQYEKYLLAEINDKEKYEIEFPSQKHFNYTARFQKKVQLQKGKNKIKLYNPITCQADSELFQYRRMALALQEAAAIVAKENGTEVKPITFSICEWGQGRPWNWGAKAGNLWRTTPDIRPWWRWIKIIYERTVKLYDKASIGHWNDPDMLEVGNGKLSYDQNKSHFSIWCMMNSPLILGNDLRIMPQNVLDIVANKNLIAINQDTLGKQAKRINKGKVDTLVKPLADGSVAVCFFNKSGSDNGARLSIKDILNESYSNLKSENSYKVIDLWSGEEKTINKDDTTNYSLKKHESVVLKIVPIR